MSAEEIINFMLAVQKLKDTSRKGWVTRLNIAKPESVADHSFACAVLAMCIADSNNLDSSRLVRMLLLHDLQESVTGDFDYDDKKALGEEKVKKLATAAIREVISFLPKNLQPTYLAVWNEFEEQKTCEAILANDIDKLEMVVQALAYEKNGMDSKKLDAFWESAKESIKTSDGQSLFRILRSKKADKN
jgi:putative hydrolase of HD superfamily